MKARLQHPMYTAAALAAANPVLLKGEVVYESDTLRRKVGDGTAAWNALPYESASGSTGGSTGRFPGYRQITSEERITIDASGYSRTVHFFEPLDPAAIIGKHLVLDAEITDGSRIVTAVPALFGRICKIDTPISVVDFTTSDPDAADTNTLYLNMRVSLIRSTETDLVISSLLSLMCIYSQSPIPRLRYLKWKGLYIEA